MKTLVIVAHPNIAESKINNAWVKELSKADNQTTIHNIYEKYPDGVIDVEAEQSLILSHNALVLQFPFFWFNTPPLLKRWLDDVLVPGFAYGPNADDRKLTGMPIGLAVSAGIQSKDYSNHGRYKYTIKELLAPLHATASYVGAKALEPFIFYGAEYEPKSDEIEKNAIQYAEYIRNIQKGNVEIFA